MTEPTRPAAAAAPGHYPIEISPPDISGWRHGNTGVDYVHELDSGRPGPTVMVQALTHGNEFCGALALDWLLRSGLRPAAGRLILAFANVEAFARFDFDDPNASRFIDEDFNRVWADDTLFGPRDSAELRRARQLQPFVDRADFLLDIHSMHEPCRPIMVCGMLDKHLELARRIGMPADLLIDTGHPAGLRMRDRGGFNDPASPRQSALVECGQHWERGAEAVARDTMLRFLAASGSLPFDAVAPHLSVPLPARQRVVRVTEPVVARSLDFRFLVPIEGLGVVQKAGTPIAQDGDKVWLAPYDHTVLVMPSLAHLRPGNTQVRLGRYDD
ncbi:succinylglutamate desuccinylase/aspartoacylase family protein [Burkholderiaceae bacterium FT117]|uniref:succinylglutamate desuccinylase/aspartoacylase domain-containing protein n=1 Tax=Zeimonas sediminis TaxID=2944268 RepID=UPI0023430625|nr:succinylglutamate desuccinylase/aspartoacylase family protein [Zeimonas sediminis]MCM5571969.1 succinylglutamate desuccinylase/aspartoacylase family protein [Zeimonas sediminis]